MPSLCSARDVVVTMTNSRELLDTLYAKEIWRLYEDSTLLADSKLKTQLEEDLQDVDLEEEQERLRQPEYAEQAE